jgi:hypothetical protein
MQSLPNLAQPSRANQGQFAEPKMIPAEDAIALAAAYRLLSTIADRASVNGMRVQAPASGRQA